MISQRCPEFQRQWVPSGATKGGRELILSVSLHSPASLHYIISKRPCVPSYHLRQDCTRTLSVQLPLRTLSLSLSPSLFSSLSPSISASLPPFYSFFPARPLRLRSTHELRAFCPVCLFLLLPLFLLSPEEKGTGGWIEGAHKAAKRAGGGRQQQVLADKQETGRVASQDLRFTFIRFSFFLLAAGSGANQNTLDSDAPSIIPGKDESWKRIGEM